MKIVLLGCPGAGKGTQAKFITEKLGIPHISTGNILREAIQNKTELGNEVKKIVDQGQLVPDDLITRVLLDRITEPDCRNGFLLDGYPRNTVQAESLQAITNIDYVIDIDVPAEEVIKRLSGRRIHEASGRTYHVVFQPPKEKDKDDITHEPLVQRPDDQEEVIAKRLQVYKTQTEPLHEFYCNLANKMPDFKYIKIDGRGNVEEIKKEIFNSIGI